MAPTQGRWTRSSLGSSHRAAFKGNGVGRFNRGGKADGEKKTCRNLQQTGHCRYGDSCAFSHDLSSGVDGRSTQKPRHGKLEETPEQLASKAEYNAWKRLIKREPKANDARTMELLWNGALTILNGDDRDWKQMLPRDLDDEEHFGREHIHTLLSMVENAHGYGDFVDLARPFLSVITHPALLDCLSVDTFVGGLYNFVSGSNGSRAIPFFQRLCRNMLEQHHNANMHSPIEDLETTLTAMSTAICKLVRREQRAIFNDGLPALVNSMENILEVTDTNLNPLMSQITRNHIRELRGMIARANGLLHHEEEAPGEGVSTTVVTSTYPRDLILPKDRHDNDKMDIAKIKILPTEDEIRSNHVEFLPSTNLDQPHFLTDQVARHLDTHFRLLRHDLFGELCEALGGALIALDHDSTAVEDPRFSLGNIRAFANIKAHIRYISFDQRRGLEVSISFPQPSYIRGKSETAICKWWDESKRFEEGSLLCLLFVENTRSSLLFFTVSKKCTDTRKKNGLSYSKHQATIQAKLATHSESDLETMTRLSCQRRCGVLIELPGVLLATFVPILQNLQQMQRLSRLPFHQWIVPDRVQSHGDFSERYDVPPPLYARGAGFTFPLNPILKDPSVQMPLSSRTQMDNYAVVDELERRTYLDRGQCQALIAALTREYAFIQGPPGTGKSFVGVQLMRVLLACKTDLDIGPIVVVCYTNHALDQFLEHLIQNGIEKIIRMGSQSQSSLLEGKNLRLVSKSELKTKSEGYRLASTYQAIEAEEHDIKELLGRLHGLERQKDWTSIKYHISQIYPRIHNQFKRLDEDGFQLVGKDPFDVWAGGELLGSPHPLREALSSPESIECLLDRASHNVHSVEESGRRHLIDYWKHEIRSETSDELFESVKLTENLHKVLTDVHDDVDRRVLQTADVIGVTTTGLARRVATLQHVRCKVVICEEAGEVMEPHMLSTLLPSVEHFIQIGDHQQLRPQINNYKLSLESQQGTLYQLDRSQFERLSVGEPGRPAFPVAQLSLQRRMRPEISDLIRQTMYPSLLDHTDPKSFPDVVGMRKNVFWLDHDNVEEGARADTDQKSHSNLWEIDMTHALVRHILRQGAYSSTDIAILTPYTGQLQKLRAKLRNDFEVVLSERDEEALTKEGFHAGNDSLKSHRTSDPGHSGFRPLQKKKMSELLRVATVDNFQGEEAKVVIVSLVRSNKEKKVGFLRTTNRINVLLSRAQHGMYLIGNTDTYLNQPMWNSVHGMLQAKDAVGQSLGLCCPRHTDTEIQVSQPDDFARLSPEGGCQLSCDRRLADCGHRCQARCHSESMHQIFSCPQPCQRLHSPCGHNCQKETCGEDCGPCRVSVDSVLLPCGHTADCVPCYQTLDIAKIKCSSLVHKHVPECGHVVEVQCFRDVTSKIFKCPSACKTNLTCGHPCPGSCGKCSKEDQTGNRVVNHLACSKVCGRRFGTCNHTCARGCHEGKDCGPCQSPCEVRCAHSRCTLKCHEACAPCIEDCTWFCEHQGKCCMPCAAPCSRLPCNQRCSKNLICGHECPGLCGETCPEDLCQECSNFQNARVDLLEMKTYREIDLNETPIAVLGCGHFFTMETLDGHAGLTEVYSQDHSGEFTGLKDVSAELARSVPRCPDCQCPIRQHCTHRYNRVINRAVIDEMSKRFLVYGKGELCKLERQISELDRELKISMEEVADFISEATGELPAAKKLEVSKKLKERTAEAKKLEKNIHIFRDKFADRNQPVQKLHDATINATRRRPLVQMMTALDISESVPAISRDRRITFGGRIVQIQAKHIILADKYDTARVLESVLMGASIENIGDAPEKQVKRFFTACQTLISECVTENLPKMAVEASLYYARIARLNECHCRSASIDSEEASAYTRTSKTLLENAKILCAEPFQNANALRDAVEESIKMLRKEWYEPVTEAELAAIKDAMVSGSHGIATHSGHWYNCANGHPFAIGECGMPMEMARCPECGAPVGGSHHIAVEGVTRAESMER